jgi:Ser/Thr protein kinase RdoA (MazF antagonist)
MSQLSWGSDATQYFFEITPDRVLAAVESAGFVCTGRCSTLNSMENRVYEVEIELDSPPRTPSERFRIVKFYRPGRWSEAQILEEHTFLRECIAAEIPVIAPVALEDGSTLKRDPASGIYFAVFPKVGGRAPDELSAEQLLQVGRLLGRIHTVGASHPAQNRLTLTPELYGEGSLAFLREAQVIPAEIAPRFEETAQAFLERAKKLFTGVALQRIHGDCHRGNLLWSDRGPFFLDFDDMLTGPAVQDFWLLIPGRDAEAQESLRILIEGYEQFRKFDHSTLRLIEVLRGLRFLHFSAWIAKRWEDPAFPLHFPQFGTQRYWDEQLTDLRDQLALIASAS